MCVELFISFYPTQQTHGVKMTLYRSGHNHVQVQGAGQGVQTPTLKNHKNIGFLSNTGLDPLKITKLPSKHSMLRYHRHASETPFNYDGVSLAGQ